ncbi:6830_t:CDS:1 [Funneliformis mosseae]|uniref:6830_t:CDS:1 n=1 Tax=Funneliformis mosseae TaxID=27381 RepID=A0A9N9FZJ9_FUNMO|nr:6830_t:CDS:1 [Funneliformis mosseae]
MRFFNILFASCLILTAIVVTSAIASVKRDLSLENGGWYSTKASVMKARSVVSGGNKKDKDVDIKIKNKVINSQMTFYKGSALQNSACYGRNGLRNYDANENDMIAAIFMKQLEMCFKCIEVRNPANDKSIIVKFIDKCADCPPESDNIDLTPTAFKLLANLDLGRVEIEWRPLKECPAKGRWPIFEEIDN